MEELEKKSITNLKQYLEAKGVPMFLLYLIFL
jgi:hypothetical protein